MNLRKAVLSDSRFVFNLHRNKLDARSSSKFSATYPEHVLWFRKNYRYCYIVENKKERIGCLRYKPVAVVSLSIAPQYWNKGYGSFALSKFKKRNQYCYIDRRNKISQRLFQKAGYKKLPPKYEWYAKG